LILTASYVGIPEKKYTIVGFSGTFQDVRLFFYLPKKKTQYTTTSLTIHTIILVGSRINLVSIAKSIA
jgi:hypothetical protein